MVLQHYSGNKPYTLAMGGNGCEGVFFRHHQSFNDAVYPRSYSWLIHLDLPSFTRYVVQASLESSLFSFVRVVFFPSKLTPVAYPNPSQAKDKILTEAVDGGTTMGGSLGKTILI